MVIVSFKGRQVRRHDVQKY